MDLSVAYRGRSAVVPGPAGLAVVLAPNLRRDRVSFEGLLRHPVRFREALAALHDVVVGDHRHKPKDRAAYQAYLAGEKGREAAIRKGVAAQARAAMPEPSGSEVADLEARFRRSRKTYWAARQNYANYLWEHDQALWRLLMPCDPVITVAEDVLFFECFSADESSYGCLTVDRDAFATDRDVALGTTNVDYSWALFDHFQSLRSYRETRFLVDPTGFEVRTDGPEGYREEKIPLPPGWLRGFMTLQAAMSLPMRRVPIAREGLYNVLAFLKRHRAARSPRAVRFELEPGRPVSIVLEPWEQRIELPGAPYDGPRPEVVRTWGRDRLRVLARLLPLMDEAEVYLLGIGLPSFWSIRMGEMRLLLGLSGWTANDWTGPSGIDQLAPPAEPTASLIADLAATFRARPAQTFGEIRARTGAEAPAAAAGLNRLALLGLVIHDLHAGLYRWRQIMPVDLAAELAGPDDPEAAAARMLLRRREVRVTRDERRPDGLRILEGQGAGQPFSLLLDADGRMLRGKCNCSHHFRAGLRRGPCRHLRALRTLASEATRPAGLEGWFAGLWR